MWTSLGFPSPRELGVIDLQDGGLDYWTTSKSWSVHRVIDLIIDFIAESD